MELEWDITPWFCDRAIHRYLTPLTSLSQPGKRDRSALRTSLSRIKFKHPCVSGTQSRQEREHGRRAMVQRVSGRRACTGGANGSAIL